MTQRMREEMAAVMRSDAPPIEALEQMIAHDIKVLEPLIDRWIEEARSEERLESNDQLDRMEL